MIWHLPGHYIDWRCEEKRHEDKKNNLTTCWDKTIFSFDTVQKGRLLQNLPILLLTILVFGPVEAICCSEKLHEPESDGTFLM